MFSEKIWQRGLDMRIDIKILGRLHSSTILSNLLNGRPGSCFGVGIPDKGKQVYIYSIHIEQGNTTADTTGFPG